jgi:hypothetical protein
MENNIAAMETDRKNMSGYYFQYANDPLFFGFNVN